MPISIGYAEHRVGAAGLGWDVPLSFIRQERSFAHARPLTRPGVAPVVRELVSMSFRGQSLDLVRTTTGWAAQRDAPDLEIRKQGNGWVVYDGQGFTYTFIAIADAGIWHLSSIVGPGGNTVKLNYSVSTPSVTGVGNAVAIDLTSVQYNNDSSGCFKNTIGLGYDSASTTPLSFTFVGARPFARMHKLTTVTISGQSTCGASEVLRTYTLDYQQDPDTRLPQLRSVQMTGRQGTPESTTPLPIGRYAYGSASKDGQLNYSASTSFSETPGSTLGLTHSSTSSITGNVVFTTKQSLLDLTGDGRPDYVIDNGIGRNNPNGIIGAFSFEPPQSQTLPVTALEVRRSVGSRYDPPGRELRDNMVFQQAIDINGDGRLDIIDAATQSNAWIIYLNTPNSTDPKKIDWQQRTFYTGDLVSRLRTAGLWTGDEHLPLSLQITGQDHAITICVKWNGQRWLEVVDDTTGGTCPDGGTPAHTGADGAEKSFTVWQLQDVNADGYPDFVFNSSRPRTFDIDDLPAPPTRPDDRVHHVRRDISVELGDRAANKIQSEFNVLGSSIRASGAVEPFASKVTILNNANCGVAQWSTSDTTGQMFARQELKCGLVDINGDKLIDYVVGTSALLGTGGSATTPFFTNPAITLPGALAVQSNPQRTVCAPPATGDTAFTIEQLAGLRDITGDGLPDYISKVGEAWFAAIGTGVGFAPPIPIVTSSIVFSLSKETEDCAGIDSKTTQGLFDVDGDGSPDIALRGDQSAIMTVNRLVGSTGSVGALESGRLIQLDNGYGGVTAISYRSAKDDSKSRHQLPFPEVIVSTVSVTGANGLGGTLAPTLYAYGDGELIFDSARDRFVFRGYQKMVQLQIPSGTSDGIAIISDKYAPATTADPFGVRPDGLHSIGSSSLERYRTYLTTGQPKDITVLSGALGNDPWALLDKNNAVISARRIELTHYTWNVRDLSKSGDPAGPEICQETIYPYDYLTSQVYVGLYGDEDLCAAHGFAVQVSVESRQMDPGADPLGASSAATRTEIQISDVDNFGRTLRSKEFNDLNRSDDDICVETVYAIPVGANERILTASSSRTVTSCGSAIYAKERWNYDNLSQGSVSKGFPTSHFVERRSDTANLDKEIRTFDATFDIFGNPILTSSTREDGAHRVTTLEYDDFQLVPRKVTTSATNISTMIVDIERDPASLIVTNVTDPNGTKRGNTFDGFDRPVLSLETTPEGVSGAMSHTAYRGFAVGQNGGRSVVQTVFTDPVAPASAETTSGRKNSVFADELGRTMHVEVALGGDYQNDSMIIGRRSYDDLGRVVFVADPFPSSQSFATAYGTSQGFNADGTLSCSVRGRGRIAIPSTGNNATPAAVTAEAEEKFPTCFTYSYQNHVLITTTRDASSLLSGSPQDGVKSQSVSSATGRVLSRSTFDKNGSRIEHATFSYDTLGHLSGMTRYRDAGDASNPVSWQWNTDSLSQVRQVQEPGIAAQFIEYSDWGETISVTRNVPSEEVASITARSTDVVDPDPPAPTQPFAVITRYDALGRVIHREEQLNGMPNAATLNDYSYDTGVVSAAQVTPTHTLGRLAQAISPTSATSFSYDGFGNPNARVFNDRRGSTYVEKSVFHGDGSISSLDLLLPDTAYADEHVDYTYDSAGRGRTVAYTAASVVKQLYAATSIDDFGRVRAASYGGASYTAIYADLGRRLMSQAAITSSAGSRIFNYAELDPVRRERSHTEIRNGGATVTSSSTYDQLGRLASAARTGGAVAFNQTFSYDALGNVLAINDSIVGATNTTMTYLDTDRDRICRVRYSGDQGTDCNVAYDAFGNIVTQTTKTGTRQLRFLADGNVSFIAEGSTSASFRYDAFGELQELDVASVSSLDVRRDRQYGRLISVRKEGGSSVITRTIPGPDGFAATRHGAAGNWTFAFGDGRGTRFVTDESGAFVQDIDYTPYGQPTSTGVVPGSPLYTTAQWNGGDSLAAFGLTHLGARLYDPTIGRFLSRDPLLIPREAGNTNPYAFAWNDPINQSDPTGMEPHCIEDVCRPEDPEQPQWIPGTPGNWQSFPFPLVVHVHEHSYSPRFKDHRYDNVSFANPLAANPEFAAALATITVGLASPHFTNDNGFLYGAGQEFLDMEAGIIHSATNPLETTANLLSIAQNPFQAGFDIAISQSEKATSCINGNMSSCGRVAVVTGVTLLGGDVALVGDLAGSGSALGALRAGEAGAFGALSRRSTIGDMLTPHHMPQAALNFTSRAEGGALVLPHAEHILTRTYGWLGRTTRLAEGGMKFRDVLARDMRDIRQLFGSKYDQGLRDLLQYYHKNFPELMTR